MKAQITARRWRRWGRAIVVHNGPRPRREQWFVACAHCAPGALLTGFTALEAIGLHGWDRDDAHILTVLGARNSTRSPIPMRVHRVRDLTAVRRYPSTCVQIPRQAVLVGTVGN